MLINVDFIYPVGCLFITTDTNFNPNITFGGTWARLEGDVYLKNVPSTATDQPIGNYSGTTNNHTIPITSMPSHAHGVYGALTGENKPITNTGNDWGVNTTKGWTTDGTSNTGGGQPYYPYYYGIICWHRTA